MKKSNSGKILVGVALILLGLLFLAESIGFDFSGQIVPLMLIALGVAHMVRRRNQDIKSNSETHADKFEQTMDKVYTKVNDFESKIDEKVNKFDENINKFDEQINKFDEKVHDFEQKVHQKFQDPNFKQKFQSEFTGAFNRNGKVKYEKAFGDLFVNCKGINVENVEVSSAIGDIELQMREALFTDGLNRLIISNFIGNVNIYLPKDLAIFVNCSNFIGDIEAAGKRSTGFGNKVESQTTDYDTATKKLYIACNSFIGDITIISV